MKGAEERLIRFMEGSKKRFVIPVYQRNYDWRMEHCKQLYDDLVKVTGQMRRSHFFGSIVSVYNPDGEQDEFLIIDGQQRLTTISLLLLAMHNLIKATTITPNNSTLGQQIYEDYLVDKWQPDKTRIKLKPIKNDQEAFGQLFNPKSKMITDSNLTINYTYFYERIQRQEITVDELFAAIGKLEIINISLNQDDNPQLIFESLNSTGLDLNEGDKIRNYVLMGLPARQQEKFYDLYWHKIEVCTAYDVSSFVRDYLSIKQQSTPAIKYVYFKFKDYVEQSGANTEQLLSELLIYARRYEILLKANLPYGQINDCIYRLNRLKTTVTRPFLMEALRLHEEEKITADELAQVFLIVEHYIFRRNICDLPTNSLNKIFLILHHEIVRLDNTEEQYVEKLKYVLLGKKESGRFPDDEEFVTAITSKNIYAMKGESKHYLFERLENAGTKETKDIWNHLERNTYSIEHIMPQTLSRVWMNDLGDDYERIHSTWLHRLANLTLTGYNSQYRNAPFSEKRDMEHGFYDSGLRLNQWIASQDKWGEEELERRNLWISNRVRAVWPQPETTYKPPQKQLDAVVMDENVTLTSKVIVKYSFRGIEYSTNSWVEMYQQVLMHLHNEDKSVLTKLAVCEDPSVDLINHFSTKSENLSTSRKIDSNVFVWTGTDTQYKINVLKKVFELFGVDQSELVFYLKDKSSSTNEGDEAQRHLLRKNYWAYALPIIKNKSGNFQNVNPSKSNWINGYLGIGGVNICCVANYDSARVELYLDGEKGRNKWIFDFLRKNKTEIEEKAGCVFIWQRADDIKASKIYIVQDDVNVSNQEDWPRMAAFHAEHAEKIHTIFLPYLQSCLNC